MSEKTTNDVEARRATTNRAVEYENEISNQIKCIWSTDNTANTLTRKLKLYTISFEKKAR